MFPCNSTPISPVAVTPLPNASAVTEADALIEAFALSVWEELYWAPVSPACVKVSCSSPLLPPVIHSLGGYMNSETTVPSTANEPMSGGATMPGLSPPVVLKRLGYERMLPFSWTGWYQS